MKKAISFLTAVLLLATAGILSSCSNGQHEPVTVLTVSGAEISDELFSYYLGTILHNPADFSLTDEPTQDEVIDCTIDQCKDYVAINTTFADMELRLTAELKHDTAEAVSTKWNFYKQFYQSAGIGKQTLTKALTADAKEKMLFLNNYGTGGKQEVPADDLEAYFKSNYVSFKAINGYLTEKDDSGNVIPLPSAERDLMINKFKTMLAVLKSGGTFDEVYQKYASEEQLSSYSSDIMTINKNNNNYPSDFFGLVSALESDSPAIIETNDYIFIVSKITENDDELLDSYRLECLKAMRSDDFNKRLSDITATYAADADASTLKGLYNTVGELF